MVARMKTTVEISDSLAHEAKRVAASEETTLRALIEAGLRTELAERKRKQRRFTLRDASFAGHGLQPGFRAGTWEQTRDAAYEGRGG